MLSSQFFLVSWAIFTPSDMWENKLLLSSTNACTCSTIHTETTCNKSLQENYLKSWSLAPAGAPTSNKEHVDIAVEIRFELVPIEEHEALLLVQVVDEPIMAREQVPEGDLLIDSMRDFRSSISPHSALWSYKTNIARVSCHA